MQAAESLMHTKFWAQVAEYYQANVSRVAIALYVRDTQSLSVESLWQAWDSYRENQKNSRMPLPSDLKSILNPKLSDDEQSREVAARIKTAIPKFGYMQGEAAKNFIGELGWEVVKLQGGWGYLCQHHMANDDGVLQAQCRDLAKTVAAKAKAGNLTTPPALPEKEKFNQLLSSLPQIKQVSQP